jgi:hypothetical protein
LLTGSARSHVTYLFCRKFATVVACTRSYQRSNLKVDWRNAARGRGLISE